MKDFKVALIQDAPILFNLKETLIKIDQLTRQAREQDVNMVLFPEAFVPAYPRGLQFGTVIGSRTTEGRKLFQLYADHSIAHGDTSFRQLGQIAKTYKILLVIGVVEKSETGTLYCTILYFDKSGNCIGKHRKLKPTAAERIIWGEGNGNDLDVYQTDLGKVGGLVCWENYMPLARTWLYRQAIEIYCAPTADQRDSWQHTLHHIATEGRCYVLGCNQFVRRSDYPANLPGEDISSLPDTLSRGGSVVIDPLGNIVAGPLWDKPGILVADISASLLTQAKMDFDVVGHYGREDVFEINKRN